MTASTCLIDFYVASVVSFCLIYQLEKWSVISSEGFAIFPLRAENSIQFNSVFNWTELNFHMFQIPTCATLQCLQNPVQQPLLPSLRIPRCCPWYGMDIFWNHPLTVKVNNHALSIFTQRQVLGHKFIKSDSTAVLCTGSERGRNWINRLPWEGGKG